MISVFWDPRITAYSKSKGVKLSSEPPPVSMKWKGPRWPHPSPSPPRFLGVVTHLIKWHIMQVSLQNWPFSKSLPFPERVNFFFFTSCISALCGWGRKRSLVVRAIDWVSKPSFYIWLYDLLKTFVKPTQNHARSLCSLIHNFPKLPVKNISIAETVLKLCIITPCIS